MGNRVEIYFLSYQDAIEWYAWQEGIKMVYIEKGVPAGKKIKFIYETVAS